MKILQILLLLTFYVTFSQQTEAPEKEIIRKSNKIQTINLIGSISTKVRGIIHFETKGNELGKGFFMKLKTGQKIEITGTINEDVIDIAEYEFGDELTGYFIGERQEHYYFGDWLSPNRKIRVPFILRKTNNFYEELHGYTNFQEQINGITESVAKNDLEKFIQFCDTENYTVQTVEVGVGKYQYIFEILQLWQNKNTSFKLDNEEDYEVFFKSISQMHITKIILDSFNKDNEFLEYSGVIKLKTGQELRFKFWVNKDLKIYGALG